MCRLVARSVLLQTEHWNEKVIRNALVSDFDGFAFH